MVHNNFPGIRIPGEFEGGVDWGKQGIYPDKGANVRKMIVLSDGGLLIRKPLGKWCYLQRSAETTIRVYRCISVTT